MPNELREELRQEMNDLAPAYWEEFADAQSVFFGGAHMLNERIDLIDDLLINEMQLTTATEVGTRFMEWKYGIKNEPIQLGQVPYPNNRFKSGHVAIEDLSLDSTKLTLDTLGLNTLNIPLKCQFESATSSTPYFTDYDMQQAFFLMAEAKKRGVRAILEFHPWIANGTVSPTDFDPEDKSLFFLIWEDLIASVVKRASAQGLDVYAVTVAHNLIRLETPTWSPAWTSLFQSLHNKMPLGIKIIYRTNHWTTGASNKALPLFGSPYLDYISVSAFFPLTALAEPTSEDLIAALRNTMNGQDVFSEIKAFYDTHQKKVMLTLGTDASGADYQRNLIQAYLTVFGNEPWFAGYSVFQVSYANSPYYPLEKSSGVFIQSHVPGVFEDLKWVNKGLRTLDERKERIRAVLKGIDNKPLSIASIKEIVDSYTGGNVHVTPHPDTGIIDIEFIDIYSTPTQMKDVEKTLDAVLPAWYQVNYDFRYYTYEQLKDSGKTYQMLSDDGSYEDLLNGGII